MYSIFCLIAVVFVIAVVPETKGRDLDDIAKLFVKNKRCEPKQSDTMDMKEKSSANLLNEMDKVQCKS